MLDHGRHRLTQMRGRDAQSNICEHPCHPWFRLFDIAGHKGVRGPAFKGPGNLPAPSIPPFLRNGDGEGIGMDIKSDLVYGLLMVSTGRVDSSYFIDWSGCGPVPQTSQCAALSLTGQPAPPEHQRTAFFQQAAPTSAKPARGHNVSPNQQHP